MRVTFSIIFLTDGQKFPKKLIEPSFEFNQKLFRERYSSRSSAVKRHMGQMPNYFVQLLINHYL